MTMARTQRPSARAGHSARSLLLMILLLGAPAAAQTVGGEALRTVSAETLAYIAQRSPSAVDTYFRYRGFYETRQPYFFLEGDVVSGPDVDIDTDVGPLVAGLSGGYVTMGSVVLVEDDWALRIGADAYIVAVRSRDDPQGASEDDWIHMSMLMYGALFDPEGGWSLTVGALGGESPYTEQIGDRVIFSRDVTSDAREPTGRDVPRSLFLAGAYAPLGLDTALVIGGDGVAFAKAMSTWGWSFADALGPYVATIPQIETWSLGLRLDGLSVEAAPWLGISADAAGRWSEAEGAAFDHAWVELAGTFFVDDPERDLNFRTRDAEEIDFHLRLAGRAGYLSVPGITSPWGWAAEVELRSINVSDAEMGFGFSVSRSDHRQVIMLPVTDATTARVTISVGL